MGTEELVGRTGHDEGPCFYRSCPPWSRTAAGRNQARDAHTSRNRAPDLRPHEPGPSAGASATSQAGQLEAICCATEGYRRAEQSRICHWERQKEMET